MLSFSNFLNFLNDVYFLNICTFFTFLKRQIFNWSALLIIGQLKKENIKHFFVKTVNDHIDIPLFSYKNEEKVFNALYDTIISTIKEIILKVDIEEKNLIDVNNSKSFKANNKRVKKNKKKHKFRKSLYLWMKFKKILSELGCC
jgi:hypothetical protein